MSNSNYKTVRGEDGTYWVSLQPLLHDIGQEMKMLLDQKESDLNSRQVMAVQAVHNFLGALIQEANLEHLRNENGSKTLQ